MISAFLLLTAQSAFTVSNSAYHGPIRRPANSRLVWDDEFNGNALDLRKWHYDTSRNKEGWYNGELQYYSAGRRENIRVASGRLTIEVRHEKLDPKAFPDWGGQEYTSAKIFSKGAGWTYGFYEVRAKLPCARGT
jgi:beta-glucanase (GH16 family)